MFMHRRPRANVRTCRDEVCQDRKAPDTEDLDLEEQADPTHAARPAIIGALGTAAALHIHS
jgi:hypothetical protein